MADPVKGEWDIGRILHEATHGEPVMKALELKNFVKTYKRMSSMPKGCEIMVKKIVRGNGIPFLSDFHYKEHFESLKKIFESKQDNCVSKEELRNWYKKNIPDDTLMYNFDKIFNMIDLDLDDAVSWTELIGFLDMEMVERFHLVNGDSPPFIGNYIQGPTMEITNMSRQLIAGIAFWHSVNKEREIEPGVGMYLSVSHNGVFDFYNLNMEHLKQITATSPWKCEGIRTVVKTMCVMPEIDIICLGCIARDLCFYDTSLGKMELVYHITNLDTHPVEMVYKFYRDPKRRSYLAIGGMDGSITALLFRTDKGGPFKKPTGKPFTSHSYHNIRMGAVEGLELRCFKNLHTSWLERVTHLDALDCLMTTSNSSPVSLALLDVEERCLIVTLDAPLGITCADLLPPPPLLSAMPVTEYEDKGKCLEKRVMNWWVVTGGLDTRLRIWDLDDGGGGKLRPRYTLNGHISRISFLVVHYESDCPLIISYGRIGRINVWNARTFENLQLYNTGLNVLAEDKPLAHCYDDHYKLLLLCTYKILALKIGRFVDKCVTSGRSEAHEIVAVLYNTTYHTLITATLGSVMTRWNPESGEKRLVIPMCHTSRSVSGEKVSGITAACFNPAENLVATGAEDGSLKLWDAYRGVYLRRCQAPGPVRWIFWREYGLMVGTNDGKFRVFASSPPPDPDHSDFDLGPTVSYAAYVPPAYLVVGTLRGELIFTDFATGRPVRAFQVTMPDLRLAPANSFQNVKIEEKNTVLHRRNFERAGGSGRQPVDAIYLLEYREVDPAVGNLVVSLRSGMVQFWSTHTQGGFVRSFYALHHHEDRVVGFTSDKLNQYLFTGLAFGYVKTWWIGDWAVGRPELETRPPEMVDFPFLSGEFEDSLAARVARREEDAPTLLNCYKAHSGAVAILIYFQEECMLMTASMKMVRYWSLTGQFLNGFGSTLEWIVYRFNEPARPRQYRIPADLKRTVSNTSLKVITKDYSMKGKGEGAKGKKGAGEDKRKESPETGEDPKMKRSLGDEYGLPWKRADVSRLWVDLKVAQEGVERVAPLPDLAQEQIYHHIPFEKTDKVTWVKPPKIIRSRRKRLELSLLYNNKFECTECKKEINKNHDRKELQPNKGISLREGVKLQEKEMARKQEKEKCRKCYWRSKEKKFSSGTSNLCTDLLGVNTEEMVDNLGILARAAGSKRIDETTMFGKIVPTTKAEINDFITDVIERKGIFDTPKNRKLIKNLIKLGRNNAVLNYLNKMDNCDEDDLIKFDCFTKKEKEYIYIKAKESLEEMLHATRSQKDGEISGIYSILANCLYETKYMDLPDNELLCLLINLSKKLKEDNIEEANLVGYKKRFNWWNKRKSSNMWDSVNKKITNVGDNVKQYVTGLFNDSLDDKNDLYDIVKQNLIKIINKEPCPQCGEGYPKDKIEESSQINEKVTTSKQKAIERKFNAHLRNCLVKASVGEIREEDTYNELCKFFGSIVHACLPKCMKCQDKNFLDPNYSIGMEKEKRLLNRLDNVRAFCQASDVPYEKDLIVDYNRAVLHAKRKELTDVIEKQVTFQKEKELNISKYEKRVEQLRKKLVLQTINSKDKSGVIKEEIKATRSKIREEFARRTSN